VNTLFILASGLAFACGTFLAMQLSAMLCENITPFDDGPRPGTPPVRSLIGASFVIGMLLMSRGVAIPGLAATMLIVGVLSAAWYSDVRCGIVPDYFTLVPLVLVVAYQIWRHEYLVVLSALVPSLPFAFAAWKSKGLGMGWGDVKLVAFGGALLGMNMAVLAFAAACVVAVAVTWARGRKQEPIAFAPYLAGVIAVAFTLDAIAPPAVG